jgi:Methylase involved in ubiquinone/menaquinone biosynthesis
MTAPGIQRLLPGGLRRYLLHFEAAIDRAVADFSASLPPGSRVLDAGAGETRHKGLFQAHTYIGVDLGVGDSQWDYRDLDAVANLEALPFRGSVFDACINIVTLEHVPEPSAVVNELARVLRSGARILLVIPHEWEEHQQPHDYFRYTRYGIEYLLKKAGFVDLRIQPVGGFFRLLSRRVMNSLQFFPKILVIPAAILLAPAALTLPLLDGIDKHRNFTLGFICTARKP